MEDPRSHAQTFERCAGPVLEECHSIATTRGVEYADSWAIENCVFTLFRATLERMYLRLDPYQMRLLMAAALCDIKDSRMGAGGAWKRDSMIDSINYRALYATLREEFERDTVAPDTAI